MNHTLLTLGDSYTIGEGLPLYENFPYQTLQLLRKAGKPFTAPEIIARTGWTTDELQVAMASTLLLPSYDFVTLLIGVNNQYRGRDLTEYKAQFGALLQEAIRLAAGKKEHVFVLSIPDWGVTPFAQTLFAETGKDAKGRDGSQIATEIDAFNTAAAQITQIHGITFIDITAHTREAGASFAADGLHPSAVEYGYWAQQLAGRMMEIS
jgi:lysophospholipase L1-like esterase